MTRFCEESLCPCWYNCVFEGGAMKRVIFFAAVVTVCLAEIALADGKFYTVPERVAPDLPYQRALIAHDGNRELLILQSKFEGEAKDFGWVVPLPAVPELDTSGAAFGRDDMAEMLEMRGILGVAQVMFNAGVLANCSRLSEIQTLVMRE